MSTKALFCAECGAKRLPDARFCADCGHPFADAAEVAHADSVACETSYENMYAILGELWLDYKDHEAFEDFVEYHDIGLPAAYMLANDIVLTTPLAEKYIRETWASLLESLDIEDQDFQSLEEVLGQAALDV